MENFEVLENFIREHIDTWRDDLQKEPYRLTEIRSASFNDKWFILNYSRYHPDFTNPLVKCCRGTVVEVDDGKVSVICAPYKKFGNYTESYVDDIDWGSASIQEKIDGIIIKAFKYKGRMYWITNASFEAIDMNFAKSGSFTVDEHRELETENMLKHSELLAYALKKDCHNIHIDLNHPMTTTGGWIDEIPDGWTLMFELVSPRKRIICKYPHTKLYFHGVRDALGREHFPEDIAPVYHIPYEIPKRYKLSEMSPKSVEELLKSFNGIEQEGVVVCDKFFRRVKMKADSYLSMKVFNEGGITYRNIFKAVMLNDTDDIVSRFEGLEEMITSVNKDIDDFRKTWKIISDKINEWFNNDIFKGDRASFFKNMNTVWSSKPYFTKLVSSMVGADADYSLEKKMKLFRSSDGKAFDNFTYTKKVMDELLNEVQSISNN